MNYESKYNELVEAARAVVEGNPGLCKTDEGLGRLSKLLPEKESEDERIRKEIVDYFSQFKDDGLRGVDITPWIAYLEKQKDAIGAARQQGYEEGLEDGIKMNMAEQMGESKEWADELSAEIDRISKRYPEVSFAKLSRVAVHFVRWQKEQKPFSQEVFDIAKHEALWGEQPPAEWSEEDEEKITFLERLIRYNVPEGQYSLADGHKGGFVTKLEAIFMLKSLRPQKLDASQLINFDPVDVLNRIKKDWPMAWEKVVWKPSEYQMKALNKVANEGVLLDLFNDLLKLL